MNKDLITKSDQVIKTNKDLLEKNRDVSNMNSELLRRNQQLQTAVNSKQPADSSSWSIGKIIGTVVGELT